MSKSIFDAVQRSADEMGACDPVWLKKRIEPAFKAVTSGSVGPELLLLHGLFGTMSNWETMIPHVEEFCKPTNFSFPLITEHRSAVKVKALAAYTEYYLRKQNLGPMALCGNSLGGHVALRVCLSSPELVDCLILSGTSGLYEHTVDTLPLRMGETFVRGHLARVFHNQEFVTDEGVEEVVKILSNKMNVLNLIHAARSAKKDNLQDRLKEIKVPVLLLWGENDPVTDMVVAELFHKHLPNSKLVTVDKCGHAPMIEHPKWFSGEVEKFLKEHSRHYKKA